MKPAINVKSSSSPTREWESEEAAPRILVADDDIHVRHLVSRALRKDGYEVHEVADGSALLNTLGSSLMPTSSVPPFDLVISDVRMPGWTGLGVLMSLRQADWALPVILITAFGDDQTHAQARRLGAAAMLDKPFEVDDLRRLVANLVPHPKPRRADIA
jgi:CheY-like chemotaxis protein